MLRVKRLNMTQCSSTSIITLTKNVFITKREPTPIQFIEDIERYNEEEGLALSAAEITYLHNVEEQQGRRLTDSEIFGLRNQFRALSSQNLWRNLYY